MARRAGLNPGQPPPSASDNDALQHHDSQLPPIRYPTPPQPPPPPPPPPPPRAHVGYKDDYNVCAISYLSDATQASQDIDRLAEVRTWDITWRLSERVSDLRVVLAERVREDSGGEVGVVKQLRYCYAMTRLFTASWFPNGVGEEVVGGRCCEVLGGARESLRGLLKRERGETVEVGETDEGGETDADGAAELIHDPGPRALENTHLEAQRARRTTLARSLDKLLDTLDGIHDFMEGIGQQRWREGGGGLTDDEVCEVNRTYRVCSELCREVLGRLGLRVDMWLTHEGIVKAVG